jgi:hypothetical protein
MMTRKDFAAIAAAFKLASEKHAMTKRAYRIGSREGAAYAQASVALTSALVEIGDYCARSNPNFKRAKFFAAAGFPGLENVTEARKAAGQEKDPTCVLCDYNEAHEH